MKLSRRQFMKRSALAGGALASASALPQAFAALPTSAAACEVVMFHDGQLWLDTSGCSRAYRAPLGALAASPIASLTCEDLQYLYGRI